MVKSVETMCSNSCLSYDRLCTQKQTGWYSDATTNKQTKERSILMFGT